MQTLLVNSAVEDVYCDLQTEGNVESSEAISRNTSVIVCLIA